MYFSLGFNFETLKNFKKVNDSEDGEMFGNYFRLMKNEITTRGADKKIDIFHMYDVRIVLSNNKNCMDDLLVRVILISDVDYYF